LDLHNTGEMITLAGSGTQCSGASLHRCGEMPIETAPINHFIGIFDRSAQKKTECRIRYVHAQDKLMMSVMNELNLVNIAAKLHKHGDVEHLKKWRFTETCGRTGIHRFM
jgi:hypothetical protein